VVGFKEKEAIPMTIHLPEDLERFVQGQVHNGRFASADEAIAEAVRLLRQRGQTLGTSSAAVTAPDPVLGAMQDAADELDEIVAEAMTHREQQPWRLAASE
jgi:putative addiction module CopG family antidote